MPPEGQSRQDALLPSRDLLAYYKGRIEDFDKERDDLLKRIAVCQSSASESHTLRCETQKRAEEVRELQSALSDAHVHLFNERSYLLQLQAENDELRLQGIEDKRRIQHLLALTQPVEQEITYSREGGPRSGVVRNKPGANNVTSPGVIRKTGVDGERVMRTIYLPTENADAMTLKVESLEAQLQEQQQFSLERVNALQEDRKIREKDESAHRANYQKQIDSLMTKLKRTEEALRVATTDYILARRDKLASEAALADSVALCEQEQQLATTQIAQLKKQSEEKVTRITKAADSRLTKDVEHYQKQLKAAEAEISQLESMHGSVKAQYEQRVSDLEGAYAKTKEKLKQVEYRRVLDMEGFTSDVSQLRKQLTAVDRKLHQMRLADRLHDDERLHGVLNQLHKNTPNSAPHKQKKGHQKTSTTSDAVEDLKGIQANLSTMEGRLRRGVLKQLQ